MSVAPIDPARIPSLDGPERHDARAALFVALGGLLALATAMGIGRFAFTPLLPLMMRDGLIDAGGGSLLAAANYAGYLVGALAASRLAVAPLTLVRIGLPAIALLTAAAAWWPGLAAWLAWRFAAGVASAGVLVGVSSWSLTALARLGHAAAGAWVFSGVGFGIALAGTLCWALAGIGSATLWQLLGALALALSAIVMALARRAPGAPSTTGPAWAPQPSSASALPTESAALVFCYGSFGFGYILPATYLPALARTLVDDPHRFGLAWPVFGLAAAVSTLLAARALTGGHLRRTWAACHGAMALGTLLPLLAHSGAAIAASALLVGGTFMVATMAGMQLARSLCPHAPTALMGRMTAAFALGQIAGPLVALALGPVRIAGLGGVDLTLALATLLLCATGSWLWFANPVSERAAAPAG